MYIIRDMTSFVIPSLFVGLVVPDVPLEETEILRKEALKNNIELVCFSIIFPMHSFWVVNNTLNDFVFTFGYNYNTLDLLV